MVTTLASSKNMHLSEVITTVMILNKQNLSISYNFYNSQLKITE